MRTIQKKFEKIEEPIAAASIAQVHKAIIKIRWEDHRLVAVKILRPNIEGKIKKDLKDFYLAAKILEKFSSEARRLRDHRCSQDPRRKPINGN